MDHDSLGLPMQRVSAMIFASVPVLQPPDQMTDTWPHWRGCGSELLIVDNTSDRGWEQLAADEGWDWIGFGKNAGVCSAWNQARAWFFQRTEPCPNWILHKDSLLLFSSSVRFDDGLPTTLDQMERAASWKGVQSQYGPHAIAWSRSVLEIGGTWDENLVSYVGDTDYFYRLILEGILVAGPDEMPRIEVNAPEPEDGRAIKRTGLITNMVLCSEYFRQKWGGDPSQETFTSPFDTGLPTWWWSPAHRPALDHFDPWVSVYRDVVAPPR